MTPVMSRPINLLSIDGGGIQGLAALVTIQELMSRIQGKQGLSFTPLPCEYFDLIVGTGIGGLIAIMLGRLRMSVDEALDWFSEVSFLVFSKKKWRGNALFKATNLEQVVGRMVLKYTGHTDTRMVDNTMDGNGCKIVVCATSAHAIRGVTLFRSYTSYNNQAPDCTIVQAVRATTAHPGLFKPVEIDDHGIRLPFVDAGLGCSNPTARMLDEAKLIFPDRHVGCIISVGTGRAQAPSVPVPRRFGWTPSSDLVHTLRGIATDCEQAEQELQVRFRNTSGIYFRFNVEQGLQDVGMADLDKLPGIVAHARHNNQLPEVSSELNKAAQATSSGDAVVPIDQLDGAITRVLPKARLKTCPPPSIRFTGQKNVLAQIEAYFLDGSSVRHIFVLHGLGGSGKTQTALKFVEQHRDHFRDIFYIDASSAKTISTDLESIAIAKTAGDTLNDALAWFIGQDQKWLIVFNNADNTSLDLQQYIPACSHGDILITTRNHDMINIACDTESGIKPECKISRMQPDDAKELLLKVSGVAPTGTTDECGATLVEEFEYLALAIVQAGTYIRVNECTLEEYLKMFRENKLVLEEYNKITLKSDDYSWTVYTTWRISYDQLKDRVAEFLRLLGFLHHEGITKAIFQNACEYLPSTLPELAHTDEDLATGQGVIEFLKSSFCTTNNGFNKLAFFEFIRELRSYSLIDFNPFDHTYFIHSLLQDWVRRIASENTRSSTAFLLALSIRHDSEAQSHLSMQISLLPHVDTVLDGSRVIPCTANAFAWVYQQGQQWEAAESLLKVALASSERTLGGVHPTTLYNVENLAATLSYQGRWVEAGALRTEALESCQQRLDVDHPHILWAMENLAFHHLRRGHYQKAEGLQLRIVDAKKRKLGATHEETLAAVGNLAITYMDLGRIEKAMELQKLVFDAFQRNWTIGPHHPSTLMSMQHLAITYARQKNWREFRTLQLRVTQRRLKVLGREHHDTRESLAVLAWYNKNAAEPITLPLKVGFLAEPEYIPIRILESEDSTDESIYWTGSDDSEREDIETGGGNLFASSRVTGH